MRDEHPGELGELALDLGQHVALRAERHLVDERGGQGAVSLERGDEGAEHVPDRLPGRHRDRLGHRGRERGHDVGGAADAELADDLVLVGEVAVERPDADAGLLGDPVGAHPGVAAPVAERECRPRGCGPPCPPTGPAPGGAGWSPGPRGTRVEHEHLLTLPWGHERDPDEHGPDPVRLLPRVGPAGGPPAAPGRRAPPRPDAGGAATACGPG